MIVVALVIAAIVAIIDQIIKYYVSANLQSVDSVTVIPNIFKLTYVENRGVAFGMFQNARVFFIIFISFVILLLLFFLIKSKGESKLFSIACGLIIGGGIGNLIDRIFLGYVVDYLSLSFFSPICNFADYAITAGTVILIVYLLFYYKPKDKEKENEQNSSNS